MKTLKALILTSALVGTMAAPAYAATVTYDSSDIPQTTVPFSTVVTLPEFNTSLGTLTGVELSKHFIGEISVQIFNFTGVPQDYTNATASIPLTVSTVIDNVIWTENDVLSVTSTSGTVWPGFNTVGVQTATLSEFVNPIPPLDFADFEGLGGINIPFSVVAGAGTYTGTAYPGVFFGGSATVGGYLDVTYTYTTGVPEASTWAMLGAGFAAIGFVGFRRGKAERYMI